MIIILLFQLYYALELHKLYEHQLQVCTLKQQFSNCYEFGYFLDFTYKWCHTIFHFLWSVLSQHNVLE